MLRFLFAGLLLIHGLIHLMGYAKAFKYAELNQLQAPISRPAGLLWLLCAVLFVLAMVLFLLKKEVWWMLVLPAVLVSQVLIFQHWQDAKFGTMANILALVGLLLGWGTWSFNRMVTLERQSFLAHANTVSKEMLNREKMAALPAPVQRWLERSNCLGQPLTHLVQFQQTGRMRTSPDGAWMPFEAQQDIRTEAPGFFWTVCVRAAPFINLVGRDKFESGKGFMLIKALSLVPVANARGPETDQGALLRYLGELVWHPATALAPYIEWAEVPGDSLAATATMKYEGVEASGVFHFSPTGDVQRFEALRYYHRKAGATLEKWRVDVAPDSFREFENIRIPGRSTVSWLLETGTFAWLELELADVHYQ